MLRFHRLALALVSVVAVAGLSHQAQASNGDPQRGRQLSGSCQVCHGVNGVGTNPTVPNIAGESEQYLIKQLQDFRAGRRQNAQMSIMAANLSDEDIQHLAAWYSSFGFTVTMPE